MAISTDLFESQSEHEEEAEAEDDFYSNDEAEQDYSFNKDIEALKRACMLTGANPNNNNFTVSDSEDSEIDDIDLVRKIHQRFNLSSNDNGNNDGDDDIDPVYLKPLKAILPGGNGGLSEDDDDSEVDDEVTLRAIERRFANYAPPSCPVEKNTKGVSNEPEVVQGTSTTLEQKNCYISLANKKDIDSVDEDFPGSKEACSISLISFNDTDSWDQPCGSTDRHQPEASKSHTLSSKYSGFLHPNSTHYFIDAIKKNRAFQKLIRNKLIQIEARIEENRKLKERIKLLKDFQLSCKKRAGRALSQKKDARILLISARKSRNSPTSKVNDNKVRALCFGPVENSHVANYRRVMQKYPRVLRRERWSAAESENLKKGIQQQVQEMLLQKSLELYSDPKVSSGGDSNTFDDIIASITEFDIPPEEIKSLKIDWDQLASLYVVGRSGAECEARWLNHDYPLIDHSPWTKVEDTKLLSILEQQEHGIHNWIDISTEMGTNRTAFQCFARYQRSLNANILKGEWTEDDDTRIRAAVETFGETNWQLVASSVERRTGTQCSNRWMKTLNPARERVGRWTVDEDKHLKVAVMLFGPKTWNKIQQFVPGRTQVQCRERWVNILDPSLKMGEWTKEEDSVESSNFRAWTLLV